MRDALLEILVKASEGIEPLETEITLIVDGFLISGIIVSKDNYIGNSNLLSQINDAIEEQAAANNVEKPADDGSRNFIHLRNAQYFASGGIPPVPSNDSVYCRIVLERVSGFHLGRFIHNQPV